MSINTYNPSVRVGNWNEDIQLEEDTLKHFLDRRDRGELLIQKTHDLKSLMGAPIALSVCQDFCIHFGDKLMVKSAALPQACVLSVNIGDPMAVLQKTITGPAVATGSLEISPNQRTVFCIESVDGGRLGAKLTYGEPFYLSTVGDCTGKKYLRSDMVMFNRCARRSRHQEVSFDEDLTFLCQWKVQHKNPLIRLEYEHEPVEANQPLVIVHCKTNNCLAVEDQFITKTPFGREYELSAHTYLDSHKAEKENNIWMLLLAMPGSTENPVPEQGPAPQPGSHPCC